MQDKDIKQIENREWIASLDWVIEHESKSRARELLGLLEERAREAGLQVNGGQLRTDYRNTIPAEEEKEYPGNLELEQKI